MRRVLFIAYLFPPIANSGTRRSLTFANHLPGHGWKPLVLTVADPPPKTCDPALLAEVRPDTRIERVPLWSNPAAQRLARWVAPRRYQQRVAQGLEWRIARLAQVPDEVASWYPNAVQRGLALHRDVGFDLIYASGWPWTSFMVARAVGLRTGVPYVLDYRDPWKSTGTTAWEVQSTLQGFLNPKLERLAARSSAAVVTVTPSFVNAIERDAAVQHVHCITNGFEPSDFTGVSALASAESGYVHVSYAGVWRPGYGLEDLYLAVKRLKDRNSPHLAKLRVSAAGFTPGPAHKFGVDDIVQELGQVSHERALELMCRADALYLPVSLGFYATASLPGKLFEYLGSGRPILAMVPSVSEVARVLDEVGGSLRLAPGDEPALASVLEQLCARRTEGMFSERRPDRLAQYTRASTTRALTDVFDQALRGQGRG